MITKHWRGSSAAHVEAAIKLYRQENPDRVVVTRVPQLPEEGTARLIDVEGGVVREWYDRDSGITRYDAFAWVR